ncbi:MAG TPA: hypothetical protein VF045_08745 [Acidimicrobiales bacterium]
MPARPEPGTPQAAALDWVAAVMDRRDLAAAWESTEATLRLVLAQDWVWNHRHDPAIGHQADWDEIAAGLAGGPEDHALWERFCSDLLTMWHRTWKGFSAHSWTVRPDPEVIDLDLEMVTFVEPGPAAYHPAGPAFSRRFAMRHTTDGWRVAGINGDQLFEPGWPPRMGRPA